MNKFEKIYRSIICEAWDRFSYEDIIKAVKDTTNDCNDPWVKGESSTKVLALLKQAGSHKRGNERIRHSVLLGDNDHEIIANDDSYITMYWRSRSKSGNSFDSNMFNSIWTYCAANEYGKSDVVAQEVGKLAYGIWKALNSRANKIEKNLKDFEENGVEYVEGQKIENLNLIIKDVTTTMGHSSYGYYYSESTELICEDPISGWKYKVRLGKNTSTKLADLINDAKRNNLIDIIDTEMPNIKNINVSGKVLRINKEWKTITLNYVKINGPSDEEISIFEKQLYDKKAEKEKAEQASNSLKNTLNFFKLILKTNESNPGTFNSENASLNNQIKNLINEISDEDYFNLSSDDKRVIGKIENLFQL